MFDSSSTWQRLKNERPKLIRMQLGYVPQLDAHEDEDRSTLKSALLVALAIHLGLFLLKLPELVEPKFQPTAGRQVYVVQPVRFKPPPPQQQQKRVNPQKKRKIIPIPDRTPDEPEPIPLEDLETPEFEIADVTELFGIPAGPPSIGSAGNGPMQVGGDVTAPQKIFSPQPLYTEEARRERVQGVVILEAIVDATGAISNIRVLKGLPQGLAQSTVETVGQWKFKPATRAGIPVAVFYNLTISFSLQ